MDDRALRVLTCGLGGVAKDDLAGENPAADTICLNDQGGIEGLF